MSTCTVCLEDATAATFALPCHPSHTFHRECLEPWVRSGHNTCPNCRIAFSTETRDAIATLTVLEKINYFIVAELGVDFFKTCINCCVALLGILDILITALVVLAIFASQIVSPAFISFLLILLQLLITDAIIFILLSIIAYVYFPGFNI